MGTLLKPSVNHDPHAAHLAENETITGAWRFNAALIGNLEISKTNPEFKLTHLGGSKTARLILSSTEMNLHHTVNTPAGPGNAVSFDGTDYIEVPDDPSLNFGTGNFGVSFWFKATVSVSNRVFISKMNDFPGTDTMQGFRIWVRRSGLGDPNKVTADMGDGTLVQITSNNTVTDGNWHHCVVTRVGLSGANTFLMYIDDVLQADTGDADSKNTDTSMRLIVSGSDRDGSIGIPHDNLIDEVNIWSEAKTANDVSDLWASGNGLYVDKDNTWPTDGGSINESFAGGWHHDETAKGQAPEGKDTEDHSDNSNHGTMKASMGNEDFVEGLVFKPGVDTETDIAKCSDGLLGNESNVVKIGDSGGRTIIQGSNIPGSGIRFALDEVEKAYIDDKGTFIIDNNDGTAQALKLIGAVGQSEKIFEYIDYLDNSLMSIDYNGDTIIEGTLTVNGDQTGATDHVFDDYDDILLLQKWRNGDELPFERGDILNRDRLLRDSIIQLNNKVESLDTKMNLSI